ncbi:MAG: hypothetical protein OJF47_003217 [Nitrospira sp.]|nr:MAG: hypothetical protein OJF47_003217 [Nitrospira sp.]
MKSSSIDRTCAEPHVHWAQRPMTFSDLGLLPKSLSVDLPKKRSLECLPASSQTMVAAVRNCQHFIRH